jgi:hypothetical protein
VCGVYLVAKFKTLATLGFFGRLRLFAFAITLGLRSIELYALTCANVSPCPQTLGRTFEIEMIAESDEGQDVATLGVTSKAVKPARLKIHGKRGAAFGFVEWTVSTTPSAHRPAEFSELVLIETFRRWKQFPLE